jgi:ubiquinone/menaquinone biosynthesis C-methylase UbiE
MGEQWDYTKLAAHYLKRPDYAAAAIDQLCELALIQPGALVCDVGAGSGHLTKELVARGYVVTAVEPNAAMREVGESVTRDKGVRWFTGTGEQTGQPDHVFDMVTFGSSFNTTDRSASLKETARILKPRAWFACLWNHRDLTDPIQAAVEDFIKSSIAGYGYGSRREDQTEVINGSGLFEPVQFLEASYVATLATVDYVGAWRSHATLAQQAGDKFPSIISGIERLVAPNGGTLQVRYTTRLWAARLK